MDGDLRDIGNIDQPDQASNCKWEGVQEPYHIANTDIFTVLAEGEQIWPENG